MGSETTMIAAQYRLQEWAAQIRDCQNRPEGMSVAEWCSQNGITKANYYYRLRRVRKACLEHLPEGKSFQRIVPVEPGLLQEGRRDWDTDPQPGLDIHIGSLSIHVTASTSMPLLSEVIKAVRHAE